MWSWVYLDSSGTEVGASPTFEARGDAESWIGESFGTLVEQGIERVRLIDGETTKYEMSLLAE